eukprot:72074-Amphidinium_carterae.1
MDDVMQRYCLLWLFAHTPSKRGAGFVASARREFASRKEDLTVLHDYWKEAGASSVPSTSSSDEIWNEYMQGMCGERVVALVLAEIGFSYDVFGESPGETLDQRMFWERCGRAKDELVFFKIKDVADFS